MIPFLVSYCEAENYLDVSRVELSDVLLAIIQQLWSDAENLNVTLDSGPTYGKVRGVLREIWHVLSRATADLDQLTIRSALADFRLQVKDNPNNQALVRQHLRPRTPLLVEAVNEIVIRMQEEASRRQYQGVVIIVDIWTV